MTQRAGAIVFGNIRAVVINYAGVEDSDTKTPWIVSDSYCGGLYFGSDPLEAVSGYISQVKHNKSVVLFVGRM